MDGDDSISAQKRAVSAVSITYVKKQSPGWGLDCSCFGAGFKGFLSIAIGKQVVGSGWILPPLIKKCSSRVLKIE